MGAVAWGAPIPFSNPSAPSAAAHDAASAAPQTTPVLASPMPVAPPSVEPDGSASPVPSRSAAPTSTVALAVAWIDGELIDPEPQSRLAWPVQGSADPQAPEATDQPLSPADATAELTPTPQPTTRPTTRPTAEPTAEPTPKPTAEPTPKPTPKPAPTQPPTQTFSGTSRFWYPALDIESHWDWYGCDYGGDPTGLGPGVYRWGCGARNNVYLLGHAWSTFADLRHGFHSGALQVGQSAWYADGQGDVSQWTVKWIRRVTGEYLNATANEWAANDSDTPIMTLQTCDGAVSQYRIIVRLVPAD